MKLHIAFVIIDQIFMVTSGYDYSIWIYRPESYSRKSVCVSQQFNDFANIKLNSRVHNLVSVAITEEQPRTSFASDD